MLEEQVPAKYVAGDWISADYLGGSVIVSRNSIGLRIPIGALLILGNRVYTLLDKPLGIDMKIEITNANGISNKVLI